MGWNEVDNKLKKGMDSNFVSCDEKYELDYIKKVIKEEFPSLSDTKIDSALKSCCNSVPAPRPRADYINCLKTKL